MPESTAARTRSARRWIVQSLILAVFMAYVGWTHLLGGPEWANNLLLICAGLGYGSAMVEADRLRRRRG